MIPVALYGTGGHAREMRALIVADGTFRLAGWIDDDPARQGTTLKDAPVAASLAEARAWAEDLQVVLAIGDGPARARLAELLDRDAWSSPPLIHPSAVTGPEVELGPGSQVGASASITTDAGIGRHVIVNVGCSVAHDVHIGDLATLAPGVRLSGAVTVEYGAWLGTGAVVLPSVRIGAWSIVGAGAVVTRDVPPNTTVVGVPARVIETRDDGWHLGPRPRRRNDLEAPR